MSHCSASGKLVDRATLESFDGVFFVRYQLDPAVFLQVVSIITRYSVMLVGFSPGEGVEVLATIPFPQAVDPNRTSAFLDGDQLVLTILKITHLEAPA